MTSNIETLGLIVACLSGSLLFTEVQENLGLLVYLSLEQMPKKVTVNYL